MAKTPRTRALGTFGLNVRKRRVGLEFSQLQAAAKVDLDSTGFSRSEGGP